MSKARIRLRTLATSLLIWHSIDDLPSIPMGILVAVRLGGRIMALPGCMRRGKPAALGCSEPPVAWAYLGEVRMIASRLPKAKEEK